MNMAYALARSNKTKIYVKIIICLLVVLNFLAGGVAHNLYGRFEKLEIESNQHGDSIDRLDLEVQELNKDVESVIEKNISRILCNRMLISLRYS